MKPLALDLFSCAGGQAVGLEQAGFRVIGIDHKPSDHWCGAGEVHRADLSTADAVEAVIRAFAPALVSSSPPCQAHSTSTPTRNKPEHPDLIPSTREGILRTGVPAWIENVTGAPLHHGLRLCGSMFPETALVRRHRWFELIGWWTFEPPHLACTRNPITVCGQNGSNRGGVAGTWRHNRPGPGCIRWREALGWLDGPTDRYSLAQCIPPAYARWLGERFLEARARREAR